MERVLSYIVHFAFELNIVSLAANAIYTVILVSSVIL